MKPETIKIDEVEYVRKDSLSEPAISVNGMPYVIIRAAVSGVHAGYLMSDEVEEGLRTVELARSRRIYYWDGAATLSQMAEEGVSKPENCKFPCEVKEISISGVCEVIKCSARAQKSIQGVAVWKK